MPSVAVRLGVDVDVELIFTRSRTLLHLVDEEHDVDDVQQLLDVTSYELDVGAVHRSRSVVLDR
jgi:hypothetical protein